MYNPLYNIYEYIFNIHRKKILSFAHPRVAPQHSHECENRVQIGNYQNASPFESPLHNNVYTWEPTQLKELGSVSKFSVSSK